MKSSFNWNLLLRLAEKYLESAERCLGARAYFAGHVSVRAALETMLYARFLLGLFDWNANELQNYGVMVKDVVIEVPENVKLRELIKEAYKLGLLNKSGYNAAERIRMWGNKIHCAQVAFGLRLPSIGKRNLEARLNDLATVSEQLLQTL